ncbi:MAG: hypothetical protein FJX23_07885 [Alphaproteobacteria bacterium]|nr:hypothetical protein [Alphaproteobacteria bacterium]
MVSLMRCGDGVEHAGILNGSGFDLHWRADRALGGFIAAQVTQVLGFAEEARVIVSHVHNPLISCQRIGSR